MRAQLERCAERVAQYFWRVGTFAMQSSLKHRLEAARDETRNVSALVRLMKERDDGRHYLSGGLGGHPHGHSFVPWAPLIEKERNCDDRHRRFSGFAGAGAA
jgi:hypothetical protein